VFRTKCPPSRSAPCSADWRACSPAGLPMSADQFSLPSRWFLTMSLLAASLADRIGDRHRAVDPDPGMAAFLKSVPGLYLAIYGLSVI